jgi:hypothetical protein
MDIKKLEERIVDLERKVSGYNDLVISIWSEEYCRSCYLPVAEVIKKLADKMGVELRESHEKVKMTPVKKSGK